MIFIALAAISYSIAILFLTVASRHMNTNLTTGVANIISAVVPIAVAIPALSRKGLANHKFGLLMAVLAGIFIGIFGMAMAKNYSLNKVGIITPLVFGGAIVLSTILSIIFLKEKVTLTQVLGLLVVIAGLGIVTYARATGK
jgi:uncharacterized membrane protein